MTKIKSMEPAGVFASFLSFLVLLVSVISVVRGQRCIADANWVDMGRDGCVNFVAGVNGVVRTNNWAGAAIDCTYYEHAGRRAQLLRFRDGSQNDADASFDALYQKFYDNRFYMDKVWVNVYRGGDSTPSRTANIHGYDTWLKTTPHWTHPSFEMPLN